MRAGEVATDLARDAESVCEHLLPQGKRQGREWLAGSVGGEPGQSLRVALTGNRAGLWVDHAESGSGGDLLDLWAACRSLSMAEAIREAKDYLGIREPQFHPAPELKPAKMKAPQGARKASEDEAVMRWLTGTRKLSPESVKAYRVAAHKGAVTLPAFAPDGHIQYLKYRSIADKKFWSEKGGVPCLFGWQAVGNERVAVLCEGELDAIAWHSYDFPALSPTNGAKNLGWIDTEFDRLAQFDQLYISMDMDEAGQAVLDEMTERLGRERCYIVSLPRKDANECLMAGVSMEAMGEAIANARSLDPDELVSASHYADAVVSLFWPSDEVEPGVRLPWQKAGDRVIFRPGEVSLIGGVNGHGKSEMAGLILLEAMTQGQRCCVASMEFKPEKWLKRLDRQAAAVNRPSKQHIREIHKWFTGRLWAFNAVGNAKADRIIEVFRYAVRRYGIRWFVVDNLAKCGFDEDDYNAQKKFVDRLTDFARDHDAHVQLCVHMRKGHDEDKPAGKMDVKGTGAITDMVDTVMVLWRNKKKEEERRIAEQAQEAFNETEKPDAVFQCVKQRNGDEEPKMMLWFCRESHQYIAGAHSKPFRYVPFSVRDYEAAA